MIKKYISRPYEVMEDTSLMLILSGNSSILESYYFPPIELSPNKKYFLGLIEFLSFNSIPNIDNSCNQLKIDNQLIKLPVGSYEISDIDKYIQQILKGTKITFSLTANNNTLKSVINCNKEVDFNVKKSLASVLGFSKKILPPDQSHTSSSRVKILKFNVLRVECNITTGAYINSEKVHTIHEFFPTVPPGYKIVELPSKVIYQPVTVSSINHIQLKIIDEHGNLINFQGETITIRLHIKTR